MGSFIKAVFNTTMTDVDLPMFVLTKRLTYNLNPASMVGFCSNMARVLNKALNYV